MKGYKTLSLIAATFAFTTLVYADQPNVVRGFFSGAQEVTTPPGGVTSPMQGKIRFTFEQSLAYATFRLELKDGTNVTAAHLHCGRAGENGPIVVPLFNNPGGVDVNGTVAVGMLTNADIDANAGCESNTDGINRPVNTIASLFMAMKAGLIYANVHTKANSTGEVRSQLFIEDTD